MVFDEDYPDGYNADIGSATGLPASVAVTVHAPNLTKIVAIPEFRGSSRPYVQPLPNERVLLVSARAEWRPDGPEHNATIFGPDGSVESTACVGDGVAGVLATPSGEIWMGYFDEGVYGNFGWGSPGPPPIGQPGLIRFSTSLAIEWEFPNRRHEPIDECEAMTLDGGSLWVYYYSHYPVVRIDSTGVRAWSPDSSRHAASGIGALAVDGDRVALAGGYSQSNEADHVVVARLDETWAPECRARLVFPDGSRLPSDATLHGHGDTLHVFAGFDWFHIRVSDFA